MAIPNLDLDGFLPEGVHECSLVELEERFGRFQRSDRRSALFAKFVEYLGEVRASGLATFVIVDGSFVTAKPEPNDIDLVLVLSAAHDLTAELRPFEYNALSRRMVRKRYGFDLLSARAGSQELDEYIEFFQQVRGDPDRRKGLLKVLP